MSKRISIDYATGASEREVTDEPSRADNNTPKASSEPEQTPPPAKTEQSAPVTPTPEVNQKAQNTGNEVSYIGNKNTKKFHYPSCSSVSDMKESNKVYFGGTREEVINKGYVPCKRCSP